MKLRGLQLGIILNTSTNDFVDDFFEPVLSNSIRYDRGVGYFSSSWLRLNSVGLAQFAQNGGHARWVTSPIMSKQDWEKLCLGNQARQDMLLYQILSNSIVNLQTELEKDELSALAWMVADNIIDFRIAIPRNELTGEFHDKFGIFTDENGDRISFSGSYNDSVHGLLNYESITVFKSWEPEFQLIVDSEQKRFDKLWNNEDPNVQVFSLPESIKNKLVIYRTEERPYKITDLEKITHVPHKKPSFPANLIPREYQNEAVIAWFENNQQGFFEMATGTGKTITSLIVSLRFYDLNNRIALIITCPYKHLVKQWEDEVVKFGYFPILAYESYNTWKDRLANKVIAFNNCDVDNICVITTHTTFNSQKFSSQINKIQRSSMLIADEAHHLGTQKSKKFLPMRITSRLALSATPTRWFDDEGTKVLNDYFGSTIFKFTLQEAIENGFLTRYYYYPKLVTLTDFEIENYIEITKKLIQILVKKEKSYEDEERIKQLLLKRANVLKNAENKIIELRKTLTDDLNIDHSIFYCSPEQKSQILNLLGIHKKIRTHQFTYKEGNKLRQDILELFDSGFLQAIVAIKCLDEGVDVPSTRMAFFLANSTNPREFIQRRGRVLRKSPGKEFSYLFDFITIPPELGTINDFEIGKSILRKELTRFKEFADNCENYHSAHEIVWDIARKFNILDF